MEGEVQVSLKELLLLPLALILALKARNLCQAPLESRRRMSSLPYSMGLKQNSNFLQSSDLRYHLHIKSIRWHMVL